MLLMTSPTDPQQAFLQQAKQLVTEIRVARRDMVLAAEQYVRASRETQAAVAAKLEQEEGDDA